MADDYLHVIDNITIKMREGIIFFAVIIDMMLYSWPVSNVLLAIPKRCDVEQRHYLIRF